MYRALSVTDRAHGGRVTARANTTPSSSAFERASRWCIDRIQFRQGITCSNQKVRVVIV